MEIAIKSVTDDELVLEGYGVIFDTVDLTGEKFTAETEFFLDNIKAIPVLWEHTATGIDDILGFAKAVRKDDVGIFFEMNLKRSNAYVEAVRKFVEKQRLGLSTGALPQTVKRDGREIKQWQICEISATVTPAEFRTLGVNEVKALEDIISTSEKAEGEPEGVEPVKPPVAEETVEIPEVKATVIEVMEDKMSEENVKEDAVKSQLDALQAKIDALVGVLEKTPANKAGYIAPDGGDSAPSIKSFGDFLVALRRNDEKRLHSVYGATKDLGEGSGPIGGYLVPQEYSTSLLQVAAQQNQVYSRVQRVPVNRESGTYPALDQFFTPTAGSGQTYGAGGIDVMKVKAGGTFQETEPSFTMLNWRVNKLGGITEVESELIEDSPFAIEALLRGLFGVAIAARNERNILRGSGIAEPMGILNAACTISVSDATNARFTWTDVTKMYSRFKSIGGSPVWIIHPSVWPDIMVMANGSDNVWQGNIGAGPGNNLNGYPIIVSEHMPQLGQTGSVLLADLSAYVLFERAGLSIAYSDQVGFKQEVGTWRFRTRNDGKPWLMNAITLADPQGNYTMSPFISLLVD